MLDYNSAPLVDLTTLAIFVLPLISRSGGEFGPTWAKWCLRGKPYVDRKYGCWGCPFIYQQRWINISSYCQGRREGVESLEPDIFYGYQQTIWPKQHTYWIIVVVCLPQMAITYSHFVMFYLPMYFSLIFIKSGLKYILATFSLYII